MKQYGVYVAYTYDWFKCSESTDPSSPLHRGFTAQSSPSGVNRLDETISSRNTPPTRPGSKKNIIMPQRFLPAQLESHSLKKSLFVYHKVWESLIISDTQKS